ncbi:unnamed protein product [Durusdinium trenchii]|uniref:C2 domain-containing protein n=1 Tax=Durusdinium trenchii TaxID=1381693 RepID=A0ABP0PFA9_9DINO
MPSSKLGTRPPTQRELGTGCAYDVPWNPMAVAGPLFFRGRLRPALGGDRRAEPGGTARGTLADQLRVRADADRGAGGLGRGGLLFHQGLWHGDGREGHLQQQSREVPLPPGRPDYGRQLAKVELPPDNVWGWQAQMQAKRRLDDALETNRKIREALQGSVRRMQRAMPRAPGDPERPPAPAPESPQSSPGGSPRYHRVKLEIEVVRATDLPSAALLSTSDPYVVVSIVDGHPLQDPEALKGYEDWRSVHEQFSGQTRVAEGTNPEFRARFLAEVRNREQTHIHFRLLDQDSISHADREIGQAVLPLVDVLGESWAAVRAIALRPMDRTNAQAWAAISKTRLHVAVISEGILGRVKNEEQIQRAAAKWQVQAHGRRAARPRADQETGLLDFFG